MYSIKIYTQKGSLVEFTSVCWQNRPHDCCDSLPASSKHITCWLCCVKSSLYKKCFFFFKNHFPNTTRRFEFHTQNTHSSDKQSNKLIHDQTVKYTFQTLAQPKPSPAQCNVDTEDRQTTCGTLDLCSTHSQFTIHNTVDLVRHWHSKTASLNYWLTDTRAPCHSARS